MNCVIETAGKSKVPAVSEEFAGEVQILLTKAGFAFSKEEIQGVCRQYEQMRNMCSVACDINMAVETANQAGNKSPFIATGEFHSTTSNIETCLMTIARHWCDKDPNRKVVFVVERSEGEKKKALLDKEMCEYFCGDNLAQACILYDTFGIKTVPVDLLRDEKSFAWGQT